MHHNKASAALVLLLAAIILAVIAGVHAYPCTQIVGGTTIYDLTPLAGEVFPITVDSNECKVAFCDDNAELSGSSGTPGTVECDYGGSEGVAAFAESSTVSNISSGGISIFSPGNVVQDQGRYQTTIELLCDPASGSTAVAVNGSIVPDNPTNIYVRLVFTTALVCPTASSPSPSPSPSASSVTASPVRGARGSDHTVAIAVGVAVPAAFVLVLAGVGFVVVVAILWWRQPR